MAEGREIDIGLEPPGEPVKELEFIEGARHPENAAVPDEGRPDLTVHRDVLPLEDTGEKRERDEGEHHRGGVDLCVGRSRPENDREKEEDEKDLLVSRNRTEVFQPLRRDPLVIDFSNCRLINLINDERREEKHHARRHDKGDRPLDPRDLEPEDLIRHRPGDTVSGVTREERDAGRHRDDVEELREIGTDLFRVVIRRGTERLRDRAEDRENDAAGPSGVRRGHRRDDEVRKRRGVPEPNRRSPEDPDQVIRDPFPKLRVTECLRDHERADHEPRHRERVA